MGPLKSRAGWVRVRKTYRQDKRVSEEREGGKQAPGKGGLGQGRLLKQASMEINQGKQLTQNNTQLISMEVRQC